MKIKFLGATQKITGSKIYFEYNNKKFLVDYGLEQEGKNKSEIYKNNLKLEFDPKDIDYVLLTHAHMDHSWLIPYLVKKGFRGKIFTNKINIPLLEELWKDCVYISEKDKKYLESKNNEKLEYIYQLEDVGKTLTLIKGLKYKETIYPIPKNRDCYFTFYNNGHILGSSYITFNFLHKGEKSNITFSWDIWRSDPLILEKPDYVTNMRNLVIENTYSKSLHPNFLNQIKRMAEIINTTYKRGWKLIIPSFALDRTQTLIAIISDLKKKGKIDSNIPVWVDTPLWVKITKIYKKSKDYFRPIAVENLIEKPDSLFNCKNLNLVEESEESKILTRSQTPWIILSASGMAEVWRIVFHLEEGISNPLNTILFVWFTVPWSIGEKIKLNKLEGKEFISINNRDRKIKASIEELSFSAHWDQKDLLSIIEKNCKLKKIFLNHGTKDSKEFFKKLIEEKFKNRKIEVKIARANMYYQLA